MIALFEHLGSGEVLMIGIVAGFLMFLSLVKPPVKEKRDDIW